jgi:hypothetical protein
MRPSGALPTRTEHKTHDFEGDTRSAMLEHL